MLAFRRLCEFWFLPLLVYLGYYYELHEMMQIRTGIMSGIFLLALISLAEKKRMRYCLLILVGTIFHISALVLLPIAFLNNKELTTKQCLFWAVLIPIGYIIYFMGTSILFQLDIPYIGLKLANYQAAEEKGQSVANINVFSPRQLFTTLLFYYLLCYSKTIQLYNKNFPLLIKIFAIGLMSYPALGFLPVLAERICLLFLTVTTILYTNVYYTLRPKWAGTLAVILIAFIYLNYALPFVSFQIFWKGG